MSPVTSPDRRQAAALACQALLAGHGVPGVSVAYLDRDGARGGAQAGRACLDPASPVRPESVFHLFSGTKLYTATALMVLAERGALSLDDAASRHLPELSLAHQVTLRQLLSHQSGLPDTLRAFLAVHLAGAPAPTTAQALARYRLGGGGPPGAGVAYRNANYALLGEVVSRVSGQPYRDFVEQAVLRPLGAAARFESAQVPAGQLVTGYQPRWSPMRLALPFLLPDAGRLFGPPAGATVPLRPFDLDTAAIGGLLGHAEAFLPLLGELLSTGAGLLSPRSRQAMLTVQAEGAAGIVSRAGVGLGWKRGVAGDTEFWNHEGGGPGFCSETRLYPREGLGVVVLMNLTQSAALSRAAHVVCERIREGR